MKHLLCILTLLCGCLLAAAQEFRSEKLPTQSQLPVANVHRIMQDSEGYMWYATNGGGLCRDDGYRIDVFRNDRNHPDLLASNDITCIAEDQQGCIWFGTTKGGYILDKKDYTIHPIKEIGSHGVSYLFCRKNGEMFLSVVGKLYVFSSDQKLLRSYDVAPGRDDAWVTSMDEDKQGNVFIVVVNDGVYRLDAQTQKMVNLDWPYTKTANYLVTDTVRGGLWIGTWGLGVVRYTKDFKRMFETIGDEGADTFQSQILNVVADQHRQLLWVITMEDIYAYRIQGELLTPVEIASVLPQGKKIIDNAALDRNGNLWVPGFSPHTFIISSADGQISRDAVQPMSYKTGYRVMVDRICRADGDGFYWIWQGRTNLSLYHAPTGDFSFSGEQTLVPAFSTNKCLTPDHGGHYVWTATGKTLLRVWHEGMSIRHERFADASSHVSCIFDGFDHIWVGNSDGIEVFDKKTKQSKEIATGLGNVRDLQVLASESSDPKKYMIYFVSAKKGFGCVDQEGRVTVLEQGEDFSSLVISPDQTVWAATTGGSVYLLKSGSRKPELSKGATNGNGDSVKDLEVDARGHLWILSDQYLKEFFPSTSASRIIRNTDQDVDMDYFHTLQVDGDSIILGGIGAFCLISPSERLEMAVAPVQPRVTAYYIDGQEYLCGSDEVQIPKGAREALLYVSTFNHLNAFQVRISYRLSDHEEWIDLDCGDNRIHLRSLEPGSYTLWVRATDEYGRWTEAVECLTVRQLDDWWKMPWVRWAGALLIVAAMVLLVLRYRQRLEKVAKILAPKRLSLALSSKKDLEQLRAKQQKKEQADAQFVQQLRQILSEHLDDTDFGVEQLSASVFMSRMNLYRRLQAAAGVTPNDFIRTIRLESAAELLLTTELSVSEISDRTGFGTARYFSRCFKDKYGMLPKEFRRQKVKQS